MNRTFRSLVILIAVLVAGFALLHGTAQAAPRSIYHGGSYFGSVVVERGQVVEGNLNVVLGDATIEGTVNGDVNVVGGQINIRDGGTITGETHQIGGAVAQSIVPWAPSDATMVGTYAPDHRLWWKISGDIVVVLFFLIFPLRTRMAIDRLERHPSLATAAGLCGWVAVIPLMVLLAITIILIPLILLEFVLLTAGVFIGTAALALLLGRRFYELLQPTSTPSPLVALVLGLVLLTAAQLVPVVGVLVTLIVGLIGLGAVILTFVPEAAAAGPAAPGPQPRSGPPMPVG